MIYYPVPLHLQPAAQPYGYVEGQMPMAELLSGQVISLPMHSELDPSQAAYIAEEVSASLHSLLS
jgi:dTDP-4-amino-4,6-dideoxygalactose transaminase